LCSSPFVDKSTQFDLPFQIKTSVFVFRFSLLKF